MMIIVLEDADGKESELIQQIAHIRTSIVEEAHTKLEKAIREYRIVKFLHIQVCRIFVVQKQFWKHTTGLDPHGRQLHQDGADIGAVFIQVNKGIKLAFASGFTSLYVIKVSNTGCQVALHIPKPVIVKRFTPVKLVYPPLAKYFDVDIVLAKVVSQINSFNFLNDGFFGLKGSGEGSLNKKVVAYF